MAKAYLTSEELLAGNKWLKTVFFPCVNHGNAEYVASVYSRSDVITACKAIYQALLDSTWDLNGDLTQYFDTLAQVDYSNDSSDPYTSTYKLKAKNIMKIFANICAKREIFWDDTAHTPQELDYFKKTPFGGLLWDFECFVSQEPAPVKTPTVGTPKATNSSAAPRAPRAAAGSGHTLYRNNAGGIVGTSKDILTVPEMYCIMGEFNPAGKTKPKIHVSPQGQNAPLKVKYTSGQGFNDCILHFDSLAAANDFKAKCEANLPANVAFLQVKKLPTDPNGYVQVDTQYGPAWIKASKLHEEIIEDSETELVEDVVTEEVEQFPESYYREKYTAAASALKELLD